MKNTPQNITVPVIVESLRDFNGLETVRCLYFSIETDAPLPGWHLRISERIHVPIILIGLSAVVVISPSSANKFNSIKKIDDFFKTIEEDSGLITRTSDIWFPKIFLNRNPEPNDLFRVKLPLFLEAHKKRLTETGWEKDEVVLDGKPLHTIRFSSVESKTFRGWTRNQIEIVKAKSNMFPEKKLINRLGRRR